jgi:hypothetical protein
MTEPETTITPTLSICSGFDKDGLHLDIIIKTEYVGCFTYRLTDPAQIAALVSAINVHSQSIVSPKYN